MSALSLLKVYYRWYQWFMCLSINNSGRGENLLYERLRREVPGHAGTRLPVEELNRSAVVNPT